MPAADTAVKGGQTIRIFLSLGPRAVRMPDLTGLSARAAALAVAKAGLKEAAVASIRLPGPPGVVAQGIAPGSIAPPDSPVDLLVNRGMPDVAWVMPDLIGRDFERVRTAFEARGFRIGGVKSQSYEGARDRHDPQAVPARGLRRSRGRDALSFVDRLARGRRRDRRRPRALAPVGRLRPARRGRRARARTAAPTGSTSTSWTGTSSRI